MCLQGDLEDAVIAAGPHGYRVQCPHLDAHCPTCGQFSHLQNSIEKLQKSLEELTERVCVL